MLESLKQVSGLTWDDEVNAATVITAITALIIAISAVVALVQLSRYRESQRQEQATLIVDVLHRFTEDVSGHDNVRRILVDITAPGEYRDLRLEPGTPGGLNRRTSLAQLLDALCAVAVIVKHSRIPELDVAQSSIAYILVKTYEHPHVKAFREEIEKEHKDVDLPDPGFGALENLVKQLKQNGAKHQLGRHERWHRARAPCSILGPCSTRQARCGTLLLPARMRWRSRSGRRGLYPR